MAKDKYKFKYIGKIVMREGKDKEGNEYKYMMLQLGNRMYTKGEKKGEMIPPVRLTKDEKANLLDFILEQDLYVFNPNDEAPKFIKKYIAVKTEDLEGKQSDSEPEEDDDDL